MMKTTQKAIRETCATNITNYSFDQANDLMNTHTLRTVAMSYGVYGMNGALFEDENGELYKSRRETAPCFKCAKNRITLISPLAVCWRVFLYFPIFL